MNRDLVKYHASGALTWLPAGIFRTWDDVKFLRDNWDGPLILKGIQHVSVRRIFHDTLTLSRFSYAAQDAEKAMSIGVDGIVVSNHGTPIATPP